MKSKELKKWRKDHNRTQFALAQLLGVSQKLVSNWETAAVRPIPVWVDERLDEEAAGSGAVSEKYSWPPALFRELRRLAPKEAAEVVVRAVISPSRTNPEKFADFAAEMSFKGLVLNGQSLYHDHVRWSGPARNGQSVNLVLGGSPLIPGSMLTLQDGHRKIDREIVIQQGDGKLVVEQRDKGLHHIIQMKEFGPVSARLEEDQSVLNPEYLGYEIKKADADIPVSIFLHSIQGYSLDARDAVGYAYYTESDFIVERIRLEVEFCGGLVPDPAPPSPHAQLIRRASVGPTSSDPNLPQPSKVQERPDSIIYRLGPLLRPRGGFLYSLVWRKLKFRE